MGGVVDIEGPLAQYTRGVSDQALQELCLGKHSAVGVDGLQLMRGQFKKLNNINR